MLEYQGIEEAEMIVKNLKDCGYNDEEIYNIFDLLDGSMNELEKLGVIVGFCFKHDLKISIDEIAEDLES